MIFRATHRVIFSLRESDIETYGFSDIIFAIKLGKAQYHSALAEYHCEAISLAEGEYN